jgi:hypothetical protein
MLTYADVQVRNVEVQVGEGAFIPLGDIKEARRTAIERLLVKRVQHATALGVCDDAVLPRVRACCRMLTYADVC